jgi:hypothetical protein
MNIIGIDESMAAYRFEGDGAKAKGLQYSGKDPFVFIVNP